MDKKQEMIKDWSEFVPPKEKPQKSNDNSTKITSLDIQLYNSFTDEELISTLCNFAKKLQHTPAQWELEPRFCAFLRKRFKNYPTTLRNADLSRSAGVGGRSLEQQELDKAEIDKLLFDVAEMARMLGRPPHMSDMEEIHKRLKRKFKTWQEVLEASGAVKISRALVSKEDNIEDEYLEMLKNIRRLAEELNRAPLRTEISKENLHKLAKRFGSWRNALYQIGLEPVISARSFSNAKLSYGKIEKKLHSKTISNYNYRVLRKSDEIESYFNALREIAKKLDRIPNKNEVPNDVRKSLIDACGTWHNVIYQLNFDE